MRHGRIIKAGVHRRHIRGNISMVDLGIARQQCVHHRYADARADIAEQAIEAGAFGPQMRRQRRQRRRAQRHEQKAEAETLHHRDRDNPLLRNIRRPAGHLVERPRRQPQPECEQSAGVDTADQAADDQHGRHRPHAARPHDKARGDDGIIHQLLQIRRLQRHRGVIGQADDDDEQHAGGEIAVAKHRRFDERVLRREDVRKEQIKCRGRDDRLDDDFAG